MRPASVERRCTKSYPQLAWYAQRHTPKSNNLLKKPVIADEIEETAKQLEKVLESGDEGDALRVLCLAVPEYVKEPERKPQLHPLPVVTTVQEQVNPEGIGIV